MAPDLASRERAALVVKLLSDSVVLKANRRALRAGVFDDLLRPVAALAAVGTFFSQPLHHARSLQPAALGVASGVSTRGVKGRHPQRARPCDAPSLPAEATQCERHSSPCDAVIPRHLGVGQPWFGVDHRQV